MKQLEINADDYAISMNASKNIIALLKQGKLDGISVMPNMSCYNEAMALLREELDRLPNKPRISVHINFLEGRPCSDIESLPNLVDDQGYFCQDWIKLLILTLLPSMRKKLKRQFKLEIEAQIKRVGANLKEGEELCLDSHQHTHMIPFINKVLFEVIQENKLKVGYVRMAQEPIGIFLKDKKWIKTFTVSNIIKNLLLNLFARINVKNYKNVEVTFGYIWGLIMSGEMDYDRIKYFMPRIIQFLEDRNRSMEVIFHPGTVLIDEIDSEFTKKDFVEFHLSKNREKEYRAVLNI